MKEFMKELMTDIFGLSVDLLCLVLGTLLLGLIATPFVLIGGVIVRFVTTH